MIGLVACSAQKLSTAAPARDLYTSHLFRGALAYAEARCSAVYVLSALHGLVELDQVLEPYDHRLSGRKDEGARWARHVETSLARRHLRSEDILILAGADYARPLRRELRWSSWLGAIEMPLEGMQIGERLAFLGRANRRAA